MKIKTEKALFKYLVFSFRTIKGNFKPLPYVFQSFFLKKKYMLNIYKLLETRKAGGQKL